jgi:hypothetical protein
MAHSSARRQSELVPTGAPFELKSSLQFCVFSFSRFQRLLRADSFGGAAGGHIRQAQCKGAAPACPERSREKQASREAASAHSQRLSNSYWLTVYKKCRTSMC